MKENDESEFEKVIYQTLALLRGKHALLEEDEKKLWWFNFTKCTRILTEQIFLSRKMVAFLELKSLHYTAVREKLESLLHE